MADEIKIQIWGTRGSMTAPYADRMVYGANTSCVSAEWDDEIVIFDCGSGIRALGETLLNSDRSGRKTAHIFISHLHLDHISGLPFCPLIYNKEWTIHLYGFSEKEGDFRRNLTGIFSPPYWPVALERAEAEILWHEMTLEEPVHLPGHASVRCIRSSHPDSAVLMRLERGGTSFVYGLDCELTAGYQEQYERFVRNASLVLFDGMYGMDELERYRGFGHSSWGQAPEIQKNCQVGQIWISHHDWGKTDKELESADRWVREQNPNCTLVKEGMEIILSSSNALKQLDMR